MKDWKTFIKAGRAKFTLKDKISGKRFTFKVTQHHDKEQHLYIVSVLTGTDNNNDYTYLGLLDDNGFRETHRSRVGYMYKNTRDAFVWFLRLIEVMRSDEDLAPNMRFYHAGCCGRCGKTLTVPESIKTGYGPECSVYIGILHCSTSDNKDIYQKNIKELRKLMKLSELLKES